MKPLRRKQTLQITTDPKTGQVKILGQIREEDILSDQGSIDSTIIQEVKFLHCGCKAEAAGKCYFCDEEVCSNCFGHCDECQRPLCPEHSHFIDTPDGKSFRLCPICYPELLKKSRQKQIKKHLLNGVQSGFKHVLSPLIAFKEKRHDG